MKEEEIKNLIKYRLEQAETALGDARFLLEGDRSSQGIVNRAYYAMFYAALALLQKIGYFQQMLKKPIIMKITLKVKW